MRNAGWAVAVMGVLAACGGESTAPVRDASQPPTTSTSTEAAAAPGRTPLDAGAELDARLRDMSPAQIDRLGKRLRADAMRTRPMTAADVERFLELAPRLRDVRSDPAAVHKVLEDRQASYREYATLTARIVAAQQLLAAGQPAPDETLRRDMDAVRPYVERIDAALKAR
ncbi:MAG: hypothetical protein U1E39_08885 [Planctomycetota bacterium]